MSTTTVAVIQLKWRSSVAWPDRDVSNVVVLDALDAAIAPHLDSIAQKHRLKHLPKSHQSPLPMMWRRKVIPMPLENLIKQVDAQVPLAAPSPSPSRTYLDKA